MEIQLNLLRVCKNRREKGRNSLISCDQSELVCFLIFHFGLLTCSIKLMKSFVIILLVAQAQAQFFNNFFGGGHRQQEPKKPYEDEVLNSEYHYIS